MALIACFAVAAPTIQLAKSIRKEITDLDSSSSVVLDCRLCQRKILFKDRLLADFVRGTECTTSNHVRDVTRAGLLELDATIRHKFFESLESNIP
jgi:hypothetical protein